MKYFWINSFCLLIYLAFPIRLEAVFDISLNPGEMTFQRVPNSTYYDATLPVQVSVQSDNAFWSLNIIGAPLSSSSGQIPINRMFVKHNLSGGEDVGAGPGYQMMNTTIHIGSGGVTSGYEVINTLEFRAIVLNLDAPDIYHADILIQTDDGVYTAILPLDLEIEPYLDFLIGENFSFGPTDLMFDVNGPPAVYDANIPLDLTYNSNNSDWIINCELMEMQGSNGNLPAGTFYVKSSNFNFVHDEGADVGFMRLSYPREIMNGTTGGYTGTTALHYRIKTDWNHRPGQYSGSLRIHSPHSTHSLQLNCHVNISGYLYIELDDNIVNIHSLGAPGLYDGDNPVSLKVATNAKNWQVTASASDLFSSNDIFPKGRLFLRSSQIQNIGNEGAGVGYMSLGNERVVATGVQTALAEFTNLEFRAKTTFEDRPGNYSGTVSIVIVNLP